MGYHVSDIHFWVIYFSTLTIYNEVSLGRISQQKNSVSDYFLTDALGSVRQIANQTGSVTLGQAYDPFGNTLGWSGQGGSSYGYAGEWSDGSGLQYLRARYYSPSTGRFISKDPFPGLLTQPASLTPYVYALNNPVLLNDPSGENPLLLVGGVGGLLGGAIYGYGSQVVRNLNQGMCFWDALSTDIDAGQVALYARVGTVLGLGMGGAMVGIQALAGYLTAGGTVGAITSQGFGNLSQAARYGIQQANQLKNAISGTGLQVHHIIEQRLAPALNQSATQARQWLSVAVSPAEHQAFTNAWRTNIGYINSNNPVNTGSVTPEYVWLVAQEIYSEYPALLEAARLTIFGQ